VMSVGAIADASSGVASFPVTVTFESTSDELTVGSTVDVEIVYERIDDAIQVPAQAVTNQEGASTVVVRTDDGDETRTVETGVTSGGMVQVTSRLEAGEEVVITLATGVPAGGDGDGGGGGPGGGGGFSPPPGFTPGGGFPGGGGAGG
jgi:multidrug efflux pump subunit AcrA (membrane-fusion protein)